MKPIAIWFHCLFGLGPPFKELPSAATIIDEQMRALRDTGLLDAASEMFVGINGGSESVDLADAFLPSKATRIFHGLESRAENLTIVELHNWALSHPDWHVLYFHSKGATHDPGSSYGETVSKPWRHGMMMDLVTNWRRCVADLDRGRDVACSHFMRNMADGTQHIAAGNFWWAKSNFIATLPSMFLRERIKQDGIGALSSRYEAEVWIGNGRMPTVKEYRPNGGGGVP